jgi:hypothetical protein
VFFIEHFASFFFQSFSEKIERREKRSTMEINLLRAETKKQQIELSARQDTIEALVGFLFQ